MTPWYTDAEIDDMCEGLTQNAAKVKYLRTLGLHVSRKYNGRPLVIRAPAEAVLAGLQHAEAELAKVDKPRPNREAVILMLSKRAAA